MALCAEEKLFPIALPGYRHSTWYVPWGMIAPYEDRAQSNHGQSLERLADRGGLSPGEFLSVVNDKRWSEYSGLTMREATSRINYRIAEYLASIHGVRDEIGRRIWLAMVHNPNDGGKPWKETGTGKTALHYADAVVKFRKEG